MLQIPIWAGVTLLSLGAVALLLGLRGRRIDREPRCPKRRCAYALGDVLAAREQRGEAAFPVICPECGREIAQRSALRIGTRRKMPAVLALAALLLAPGAAALGFHAYAAYQSTKAVQTMPLWLLLRNAERDSVANRFVHQNELYERARRGAIHGKDAERVVQRVLDWQTRLGIQMPIAGDAFSALADQGYATRADIERFWDQIRVYELLVPERVEAGGPLPIELRVHYRGGQRHNAPLRRDMHNNGAGEHLVNRLEYTVTELRINGVTIDLDDSERRLWIEIDRPRSRRHTFDIGWQPKSDVWDKIRTPAGSTRFAEVDVTVRWVPWEYPGFPMARDITQDFKQTLREGLEEAGLPTSQTLRLSGRARIVQRLPEVETVADGVERAWLEEQFSEAVVEVLDTDAPIQGLPRYPQRGSFVAFPHLAWDASRPWTGVALYGDLVVRHESREFPVFWNDRVSGADLPPSMIHRDIALEILEIARDNPEGWELVFTPRPERATRKVDRPTALGGPPIVVPVEIKLVEPRSAP
ncbi:MAG: hypothetical protein ACTS27_02500 [Phycisphaerales bacterium]